MSLLQCNYLVLRNLILSNYMYLQGLEYNWDLVEGLVEAQNKKIIIFHQ